MACVYIGPDHRPLVFFLPYNMDEKELSALQEDAPSRGLRVTHSFSKKDVEIVISNQLQMASFSRTERSSWVKRLLGRKMRASRLVSFFFQV